MWNLCFLVNPWSEVGDGQASCLFLTHKVASKSLFTFKKLCFYMSPLQSQIVVLQVLYKIGGLELLVYKVFALVLFNVFGRV